jgi:hypothetical protein
VWRAVSLWPPASYRRAAISTNAIRAGLPDRLAQAWLVPRWISTSPARSTVSLLVHDGDHLAFHHQRVVHRFRAVHARMLARPGRVLRVAVHAAEGRLHHALQLLRILGFRREVDDAQHRAAFRRRHPWCSAMLSGAATSAGAAPVRQMFVTR